MKYATDDIWKRAREQFINDGYSSHDTANIDLIILGDELKCEMIFDSALSLLRKMFNANVKWDAIIIHEMLKQLSKESLQSIVWEFLTRGTLDSYIKWKSLQKQERKEEEEKKQED